MNGIENNFLSIEQLANQYLTQTQKTEGNGSNSSISFQDILKQKSLEENSSLKFSKHALGRLNERNITLDENQLSRLEEGTAKARAKGIKDSLVIVDRMAFIVNVPNQTVVTAMDSNETNENVFTNINGAVIM